MNLRSDAHENQGDGKLVAEFRPQMPVTDAWAYFDHAAVAPLSGPARAAIAAWATEAAQQGATVWSRWVRRVEQIRERAATMIAATPEEIALVHNTTTGISLIAEGLPWQAGDNVVTLSDEFPSNVYPWMNLERRGVETRRVPTDDGRLDLNQLDEACDARTRVVSISWVGFATGYRHDLAAVAEVAHRHGALLMVDAIQALGAFPLDVSTTPIDFLAADGHKWQLGPEGSALLYVRREHLDRLHPMLLGWNSVVHDHDFDRIEMDLKAGAVRYEGGSQNMPGVLAHGASLDLLARLGIERVAAQILSITDLACERLRAIGATIVSHREGDARSGIVAFELPGHDPQAVRRHCFKRQVMLSCRAGRLRISPHAYNNVADVDRLIEVLEEAMR